MRGDHFHLPRLARAPCRSLNFPGNSRAGGARNPARRRIVKRPSPGPDAMQKMVLGVAGWRASSPELVLARSIGQTRAVFGLRGRCRSGHVSLLLPPPQGIARVMPSPCASPPSLNRLRPEKRGTTRPVPDGSAHGQSQPRHRPPRIGRARSREMAGRTGGVSFEQQEKAFSAHNHVMIPA